MLTREASRALAESPLPHIGARLASLSEQDLRLWVERLAVPRHFEREQDENKSIALWIAAKLQSWSYRVELQGPWWNVVALPKTLTQAITLVCAHYDSVAGCPGADDNASAVAGMLGCAQAC